MSVKENLDLHKRPTAFSKTQGEVSKSLVDVIKLSSLTADGRKVVENWSQHWKNSCYGKRTGKPVSIFHDVKKLFPSSPSSHSDLSDYGAKKNEEPVNVSYLDNKTFNVDESYTNDNLTISKSKSIKRRLSFSEKKNKSNHHQPAKNSNKCRTKQSLHHQQKNSTVVTLNTDISNSNIIKTCEDIFIEEQSACDSQFLCSSSHSKSKDSNVLRTNLSTKTTPAKIASSTKASEIKLSNCLQKTNRVKDLNADSHTLPSKPSEIIKIDGSSSSCKKNRKRTNNNPISEKLKKSLCKSFKNTSSVSTNHNNGDSQDVQTKGLRSWLTKTVSYEDCRTPRGDSSVIESVMRKPRLEKETNPIVGGPFLSVVVENIGYKLKDIKNGIHLQKINQDEKKKLLFEVDASAISHINDGGPDMTKSGPPMSTPRQQINKKVSGKNATIEAAKQKVAKDVDTNLSLDKSDESIEIESERPSPLTSNDDTYAESHPVFVCESKNLLQEKLTPTKSPELQDKRIKKKRVAKTGAKNKQTKEVARTKPHHKSATKLPQSSNFKKPSKPERSGDKNMNVGVKKHKRNKLTLYERQYAAMTPPELVIPLPSPDAVKRGLRRSKRARTRPLMPWLGEKLVYNEKQELLGLQTSKFSETVSQDEADGEFPLATGSLPSLIEEEAALMDNSNILSKNTSKVKNKKKQAAKKKSAAKRRGGKVSNNLSAKSKLSDNIPADQNQATNVSSNTTIKSKLSDNPHPNQDLSSTTIRVVQNGQDTTVEASSLVSIPENEVAFGLDGQKWKADDPVRFTKGISTPQYAMGTVMVGPGQEKTLSRMKTDTLCFFVAQGVVEVTIESAVIKIPSNSYFHIPPLNNYNIKNASQQDSAFLFFSQIKNRAKPMM